MIELTVVDIVPEARHSDTVYTQTVACRLKDGQEISVFDSTPPVVSEEIVGSTIRAILLGRSNRTTVIDAEKSGFEEIPEGDHRYWGEVLDIATVGSAEIEAVEVNVGKGTIFIEPDPELEELLQTGTVSPGSWLSIETYRTDIVDFEEV